MRFPLPWLDKKWGEAFLEVDEAGKYLYISFMEGINSRRWKPVQEYTAGWLMDLSDMCIGEYDGTRPKEENGVES